MAAEEINRFLIEKLKHGLKDGSKKLPLHSKFEKLTNLYEIKLDSSLSPSEMSHLRVKLYDLANTMTECRVLYSHRRFTIFLDTKDIRADLKSKIEELEGQANQVRADPTLENNSHPKGVSTPPEILPESREFKIYGFEDSVKSVEKMVFEEQSKDQFKAVAIIGKVGVGKTALAQQIFNGEKAKSQFVPRVWVCSSKQPNEREDPKSELISRILTSLGIEEEIIHEIYGNHSLKGLIYLLHLNLKGKKYLIVLDNVWNIDLINWYEDLSILFNNGDRNYEWGDKLSDGLPKGNCGRVIVTTRSEELAEKMVGNGNVYRILPLADQENWWKIFEDQIQKDGVVTSSEKLKTELLMNCAGNPLAAKLMGQIMANDIKKIVSEVNPQNENLPVENDLVHSES